MGMCGGDMAARMGDQVVPSAEELALAATIYPFLGESRIAGGRRIALDLASARQGADRKGYERAWAAAVKISPGLGLVLDPPKAKGE